FPLVHLLLIANLQAVSRTSWGMRLMVRCRVRVGGVMSLKSKHMRLSRGERSWLPWWGALGKLRLGWSCWVNRKAYGDVESIFEDIAQTRIKLLTGWTENQWEHLQSVVESVAVEFP